MDSIGTEEFWQLYRQLPRNIRKAAQEKYALWQEDHSHPSLRFKPISQNQPVYSARVNEHYRVLGLVEKDEDTIYWFWIGTHTEYDLLIKKYQ